MPGSMGLFQHAIMESGSCGDRVFYFTAAAAQAQASQLAQALGCTDPSSELSCMRAVPPDTVLTGLPARKALIGPTGVDWGPVVDGVVLPALPIDAIRAGHFAKVPVLLGSNHDEGNLFTFLWGFNASPPTASDALAVAQLAAGANNGQAVVDHYSGASYPTPSSAMSAILTDGGVACPTRRAARALVAAGGVAYLYQFTHPFSPALAPGLGAAHSFEIPYVFGNTFLGSRPPDADAPLIATMQGYWGRFAQAGDPNGGGAATWSEYTAANDENIVLDLKVTTESGLKKSDCDFWDGLN